MSNVFPSYLCTGWYSAEYSYFALETKRTTTRSIYGGYSGDNGDAMQVTDNNYQYYQNGMNFSTFDHSNDNIRVGHALRGTMGVGGTTLVRIQILMAVLTYMVALFSGVQ